MWGVCDEKMRGTVADTQTHRHIQRHTMKDPMQLRNSSRLERAVDGVGKERPFGVWGKGKKGSEEWIANEPPSHRGATVEHRQVKVRVG